MTMSTAMSRRFLLGLGAGAFAGTVLVSEAASAQAQPGGISKNEMIVRKWYRLWETEKTNWGPFDALLADDFTFTSAAPDDHISKTAFKKNCWDTQIERIKSFDLELVMAKGDFVTVRWLCHTTNGKAFRDVEVHRLRGLKIEALKCYFGGPAGFPTAVESQKS
jgi:ketosteroid isomerase-like protein